MRKLAIAGAVVAVLGAVSAAQAASATGVIKSIDTAKDTVTLDNGSIYWMPSTVKLSNFKVGQKVSITYSSANGKMSASALVPAT